MLKLLRSLTTKSPPTKNSTDDTQIITRECIQDILDSEFVKILWLCWVVNRWKFSDKKMIFSEEKRQLTEKEIIQLVWHSFRFSNGYPPLQFRMMYQAWKKYGVQDVDIDKCWELFQKVLKVWETHTTTTTTEWENPDGWRPPHPKICRHVHTVEHGTDIALSLSYSHGIITKDLINEWIEPIRMLLTWKWYIIRRWEFWDKTVSKNQEFENVKEVIEDIFKRDFEYILHNQQSINPKNWNRESIFPWRPNRKSEYDGSNTLKDRYFSYFVWFIVRDNSTWNRFFDEYFWELRESFKAWFVSLPSDKELDTDNREKNFVPHSPFRKDRKSELVTITKEDVLYLIAHYNLTHPKTPVVLEEIL